MSIEGVAWVRKRLASGKSRWYCYAWRGGPCIMTADGLRQPKLTAEALEAYEQARNALRTDTIDGLVRAYRQSPEWNRLAESTKRNWRLVLDKIVAKWGKTPLSIWSDPRMVVKVMAWRNSAQETPRAADYRITVLRALLEWARLGGRVTVNVAQGIPTLYQGGDRAEIIWTAKDREAFAKVANEAVIDALELACLSGLRLADLAGLTWAEVGQHAIVRTAQKRSKGKRRRATVPLYPALREHLEVLRARPRHKGVDNVLTTSAGNAWSSDGLGKRVGEARTKAGIKHSDGRAKHLHDCRGTFATELMLAGLTDEEIGRILAWEPTRVANIRSVYVDEARTVVALGERIAANHPANRQGVKQ